MVCGSVGGVTASGTRSEGAAATPSRALLQPPRRHGCWLIHAPLFLVFLLGGTSPSVASNDDGILMGNDAALSAGAVTATTTEATALWYNPAGLGGATRHSVDASASAFILRVRPIEAIVFTTLSNGEVVQSDLDNVELISVGASLANAWRISDGLTLSLGVFQPESERFSFRAFDVAALYDGVTVQEYRQHFSASLQTDRTHLGIGVGWQVLPRFRLGVALFGIYRTTNTTISINAGAHDADNPENASAFGIANSSLSLDHFGLQLALGIQWVPVDGLHVGLTLRTPALVFGEIGAFDNTFGFSSSLGPEDERSFEADSADLAVTGAAVALPFQAQLALAYAWSDGWISAEFDLRAPFYDAALDEQRELTWNVRAGFQQSIDDEWRIGAGLFTDRSNIDAPDVIGEFAVDYYGLTIGLQMKNTLDLKLEDRPELEMITTLALRYAAGFGQAGAFDFDPLGTATNNTVGRDVVFHEFTLHLGSSLGY